MRSAFYHAARRLLDVAFPPRCASCERGQSTAALDACGLCVDCIDDLEVFSEPVCRRCSTPTLVGVASDDCPVCRDKRWAFDRVVALGAYDGLLRQLVLEAKHPGGADAAMALGRLLASRHAAPAGEPAIVVAVPQHWRRRLSRRADGVASLAEGLARGWGLPLVRPLIRRRATRRQTEVAPSDRPSNVRGAFAVRKSAAVAGKLALLVDDVLTTGSTCHAAARALRDVGAARVIVVAAARRVGGL
jgi:ComF family protein